VEEKSMQEDEVFDGKSDPRFNTCFIDQDEERVRTLVNGEKIKFRFIHGGFADSPLKFSFSFPEKEAYQGRFFQQMSPFPGPDEELSALQYDNSENDWIGFALTHGGYFVESNMGSAAVFGNTDETPHNSALVAEVSRVKAVEVYGYDHRPYGYVFGGSGGGYRTIACIENTNAFDGAIPYIIGSPYAIPNCQTTRAYARRNLRNKIDDIIDAVEPGGSGDPYATLNEEEKEVLQEVLLFGLPLRSIFTFKSFGDGALPVLMPGIKQRDPEYFTKYWTTPGYLGADPNSNACRDRIFMESQVVSVFVPGKKEETEEILSGADTSYLKMISDGGAAEEPWIEFTKVPQGDDLYLEGTDIKISTGKATGKWLRAKRIEGKRIYLGEAFGLMDMLDTMALLQPGDQVTIDNSDYVAVQTYHRHQVPAAEYHGWDLYRDENGQPLYPQEPELLGPGFSSSGPGCKQNGHPNGKVIIVACYMDEQAYAWQADWYRNKIAAEHPDQKEEDLVRLYYFDHSLHDNQAGTVDELRVTSYLPGLRQALVDLSQWVEQGVEPLESSHYTVHIAQVDCPEDGIARGGLQPVAHLLANGSTCAKVKPGQEVHFSAQCEMPNGAGSLTKVEWSFEGEQDYPYPGELILSDGGQRGVAEAAHTYQTPGTYFAVVRIYGQRQGDRDDVFTNIKNIERVRVVVA
jgi:hypothetical protein